jgi:hypothetical protein
MIEHMQLMMHKMGAHVDKLKDLLDPDDLEAKLKAAMDSEYNPNLDLSKQIGVKTFDTGINRLIDYLKILNNNYELWIRCICKDGETWSPKKGICCPAGHTVDPATGDCKIVGCTGGKVRQADGSCECPDGTLEINGVCIACAKIPGHALDSAGKCVKCDDPNEVVKGHCVPKCPTGTKRNTDGICVPVDCPPGQMRDASGNCVPIPPKLELNKHVKCDIIRYLVKILSLYSLRSLTTKGVGPFPYPDLNIGDIQEEKDGVRLYPPITQANLDTLKKFGSEIVEPLTANLPSVLNIKIPTLPMLINKSPIKTVILPENENDEQTGGKKEKKLVSELFSNIVIPNWALCYDNPLHYFKYDYTKDDDDEVIEDDLHNKLLDLVKHSNKNNKNKFTKRKREKNKNKGKKTKKY